MTANNSFSFLKINFKFKVLLALLFQLFQATAYSQTNTKDFDYSFTQYLIHNENFAEAEYLITEQLFKSKPSFADTANYLKGMLHYHQKKLEASSAHLLKIHPSSEYFVFAQFLAGYEKVFLHELNTGDSLFKQIVWQDSLQLELINFERASIALLQHNFDAYQHQSAMLSNNYYQLNEHLHELNRLAERAKEFNPKSPVVAGLLSAVIPGSGKMYAGKIGEGVTALIGLSILGAITYENYRKAGLTNYKTITFGSLFTLFYVSNIYGSIFSVKVYREEFYNSLNHAILFNMHIPIRTVFRSHFK